VVIGGTVVSGTEDAAGVFVSEGRVVTTGSAVQAQSISASSARQTSRFIKVRLLSGGGISIITENGGKVTDFLWNGRTGGQRMDAAIPGTGFLKTQIMDEL
jgi:hypothetical protein